jgi:hypothetical protein
MMADDIDMKPRMPSRIDELQLVVGRQYEIALETLLLIRDAPGTQEVEWYRDVAERALTQIALSREENR